MNKPTEEQIEAVTDALIKSNIIPDAEWRVGQAVEAIKLLSTLLAQREAAAKAEGVREGIEMAAKLAEAKATRQEEILKNPPHKLTEAMRHNVYSKRDLWDDHAAEIRNLLREGGE